MVKVVVREGETIEHALRRFSREVLKEGILTELKKREFYEKPSVVRKREKATRSRKIKKMRKIWANK